LETELVRNRAKGEKEEWGRGERGGGEIISRARMKKTVVEGALKRK